MGFNQPGLVLVAGTASALPEKVDANPSIA